jgi:TonB family protein
MAFAWLSPRLAKYVVAVQNAAVIAASRAALLLAIALLLIGVNSSFAQVPATAQTPASPTNPMKLDYPDTTSGLERLAKEILKAQKEGDSARASALAQTMVLPDPAAWYLQTFGPAIANDEGAKYAADQNHLPAEILTFFFGALQNHNTDVAAGRFTETCDDNAGETAFGTLQLRIQPIPLYELRFRNGDHFLRMFAFVYVDGGFRFVLAPKIPNHFPYSPRPPRNPDAPGGSSDSDPPATRIRQGGSVQAAKLVNRVQPQYPPIARDEHLQGTVRLHAIIGKDGAVSHLVVLQGYCSLAKSSMDAVSKWRYTPTLFSGQPVEVDTTIDVIFSLNH